MHKQRNALKPRRGFSALQRAEIAEMRGRWGRGSAVTTVSVLFNEPKLLKSREMPHAPRRRQSFSALQRAEIAEINPPARAPFPPDRFSALQRAEIAEIVIGTSVYLGTGLFQCSSTSRNC